MNSNSQGATSDQVSGSSSISANAQATANNIPVAAAQPTGTPANPHAVMNQATPGQAPSVAPVQNNLQNGSVANAVQPTHASNADGVVASTGPSASHKPLTPAAASMPNSTVNASNYSNAQQSHATSNAIDANSQQVSLTTPATATAGPAATIPNPLANIPNPLVSTDNNNNNMQPSQVQQPKPLAAPPTAAPTATVPSRAPTQPVPVQTQPTYYRQPPGAVSQYGQMHMARSPQGYPMQHQQRHGPPVHQNAKPQVAQAVPQRQAVPTGHQQQGMKRKLVLTTEGRNALTQAVLSSLKDPQGKMDPTLLQKAKQCTGLTEEAILKAATMAREKESAKRDAARNSATQNRPVTANQVVQQRPQVAQQPRAHPQQVPVRQPMPHHQYPHPQHYQNSQHLRPPHGYSPGQPHVMRPYHPQMRPAPTQQSQGHYMQNQTPMARAQQRPIPVAKAPSRPAGPNKPQVQTSTPLLSPKSMLSPKKIASPNRHEVQMKALKQFNSEMTNWNRIQNGFFLTSTEGETELQVKACNLGSIVRTDDVKPVIETNNIKSETVSKSQILALQTEMQAAGIIEGIVPVNYKEGSCKVIANKDLRTPSCVVSVNRPRRFDNATVSLLDVSEKYKRLKLQPRKDSRALEKNIRKHRHVTCETLVRQLRELNRSITSHSTDFYKFHRARKVEIAKFAKSVRDHVAAEKRKKEKSEVNEEKARIAALKANDMEAYQQLMQDTRNDRLKFLWDKTDQYMAQISGMLTDAQGDNSKPAAKEEDDVVGSGNLSDLAAQQQTSNYYETAHVRQEEVKQPSILSFGTLKGYQLAGLKWLVSLYNNKLNGILADEMGLGKTVQTIALIAYLMEMKDNRGPYLVIVPLSTLSNWVNEFRRWCPSATVVVYKGTPAQRKGLYKTEVRGGHFNVLLTTYEYIIKDKSSLRKIEWEYAIVDEGHRMKNSQSKFAVTLGTMYTTKHRVLLTGTPLQNSLPELWSLLNFLLPQIFNSVETFDQWFNKPFSQFGAAGTPNEEEETVNTEERLLIIQRLHELLRPFMLRRIKADVLDQLPDKVEKVLRCELSSWQKELYKQISYSILEDGQKKSKRGLNNVVMQLRKVCNHPYMFTPEGYYITEDIIRTSGKFELLDRMLPRLKAGGHRILMFFQMTAAMTIMEDYLKYRNLLSLRLDGSTTGEERERRMDLFNAPNSPYFIFMLSTRAGGLGLNLVTADTVIIFDSDWNPMMDLQAQDRAHRIGQKKVVSVFRLITNSPVEEKILQRANEKLNMSELVVGAGKFDKQKVEDEDTEERQKIMELLLTDFDTSAKGSAAGVTGSLPTSEDDGAEENEDEKEEIDINELLSRNDEDYEFYTKLDSGEVECDEFFESPGLATDPDDIPDWIKYPGGQKEADEEDEMADLGPRRAAANVTKYDDGLTEKQYLRIMEKQAEQEENAAKARKREWKLARDKKAVAKAVSALTVTETELEPESHEKLVIITKAVIALRDPQTKSRYSDIFREQPSRDEYPQYYAMIDEPIAINDIMKKCKAKIYNTAAEFQQDWVQMFANALKFNGEGSWIVNYGKILELEVNRLMRKYEFLQKPKPKAKPSTKAKAPSPAKKKKPKLKLKISLGKKRKKEDSPGKKSSKKSRK